MPTDHRVRVSPGMQLQYRVPPDAVDHAVGGIVLDVVVRPEWDTGGLSTRYRVVDSRGRLHWLEGTVGPADTDGDSRIIVWPARRSELVTSARRGRLTEHESLLADTARRLREMATEAGL